MAHAVRAIAGDALRAEVMLGAGQSPETYQVGPRQMDALSRASLYFHLGLPFEVPLMDKLRQTAAQLRLVDARRDMDLSDRPPESGHGDDPHVWLDPMLFRAMGRPMYEELVSLLPGKSDEFSANLDSFEAEMAQLHERIARRLAPFAGRRFYVYHPAFGYFARRYGIEQIALEHEGKPPGSRRLRERIVQAKSEGVKTVFVQAQFSVTAPRAFAEAIGARVVVLDPLAADYPDNLERIAEALATAFEEAGVP
jgi:zinc transport system substrate-binding protein